MNLLKKKVCSDIDGEELVEYCLKVDSWTYYENKCLYQAIIDRKVNIKDCMNLPQQQLNVCTGVFAYTSKIDLQNLLKQQLLSLAPNLQKKLIYEQKIWQDNKDKRCNIFEGGTGGVGMVASCNFVANVKRIIELNPGKGLKDRYKNQDLEVCDY